MKKYRFNMAVMLTATAGIILAGFLFTTLYSKYRRERTYNIEFEGNILLAGEEAKEVITVNYPWEEDDTIVPDLVKIGEENADPDNQQWFEEIEGFAEKRSIWELLNLLHDGKADGGKYYAAAGGETAFALDDTDRIDSLDQMEQTLAEIKFQMENEGTVLYNYIAGVFWMGGEIGHPYLSEQFNEALDEYGLEAAINDDIITKEIAAAVMQNYNQQIFSYGDRAYLLFYNDQNYILLQYSPKIKQYCGFKVGYR